MRALVFLMFVLLVNVYQAQLPAPSVYNSAGGTASVMSASGEVSVYYNIGEPIYHDIQNSNDMRLTQGFLQPDIVGNAFLQVSGFYTHMICEGSDDASMILETKGGNPPFRYRWFKNEAMLPDTLNKLEHLAAGTYSYMVTDAIGITRGKTFEVGDGEGICLIVIRNGLSPNNDGYNDYFRIDYIEEFPNNKVSIYNRWGNMVWQRSTYNNSDVAWRGEDQKGSQLPGGTYFYIVQVNKRTMTGWVELMR